MRRCITGALLAGVLSLGALALPAQAQVDTEAQDAADDQMLRAVAQLSQWVGEAVPLEHSLCVRDAYGPTWPVLPAGQMPTERVLERVQALLAQCVHAQSQPGVASGADRGLLLRHRADYQRLVQRLAQRQGLQRPACAAPVASAPEPARGETPRCNPLEMPVKPWP